MTTILYLTDSRLDESFGKRVRHLLKIAAGDLPIVSVSQKPLDFGDNICVGDIGKSETSLYHQMFVGLQAVKTKNVAIAEHDCVYSIEHFAFQPDDENFWYNTNCWLAQLKNPKFPEMDGMYSFIEGRKVQSQLVSGTDILLEATVKRLKISKDQNWPGRLGEPGTADPRKSEKLARKATKSLLADLRDYINTTNAKTFATSIPNIDIRHGDNFTGPRRGKSRTFALMPWGTLDSVLA